MSKATRRRSRDAPESPEVSRGLTKITTVVAFRVVSCLTLALQFDNSVSRLVEYHWKAIVN